MSRQRPASISRLDGKNSAYQYPNGSPRGQAGWDLGVNFDGFADLLTKLQSELVRLQDEVRDPPPTVWNPLPTKKMIARPAFRFITRLAIHCHGGLGQVYINGQSKDAIDANSASMTFLGNFTLLATKLTKDATVLFMCCMSGQGTQGTELVKSVSKVLPGCKVVAFETIGYAPGGAQNRPGEGCAEPGMRMTTGLWGSPTKGLNDPAYSKDWNNLSAMPWASENGTFAKVALNGAIIKSRPGAIDP